MNKKIILEAVGLGLALTLSACGTTTNKPTAETSRPMHRPDFGQPDSRADVRGLVKSVIGNQVTILKIDLPQGKANGIASSTDSASSTDNKRSGNSQRQGEPSLGMGGGMGGFGGSNRSRSGSGSESSSSSEQRAALLEKMKEMSTGEETVTIPVGIKMLKPDSSDPRTMVEASLSDITADKSITIWLAKAAPNDKSSQKTAEFVIIN